MLATNSYSMSSAAHNAFLPPIPSPLSPRSANVSAARRSPQTYEPSWNMSHPGTSAQKENYPSGYTANGDEERTFVPYSKRTFKKAPSPRQDELRERRRGAFLRRVQEQREEGRAGRRGEDIMRLEYMRQRRAWEAELASQAAMFDTDIIEEEEEELPSITTMANTAHAWPTQAPDSSTEAMHISAPSTQEPWTEKEVDEVLQMEDEELEALLEHLPDAEKSAGGDAGSKEDMHLYSDDDDYDALFSEFVEQDAIVSSQQKGQQGWGQSGMGGAGDRGGEAMDMS